MNFRAKNGQNRIRFRKISLEKSEQTLEIKTIQNEQMEPEFQEIVAPKFLENLRRDFSEGNEESFHKTDPLLIQEQEQAQEQLILKVSFFVVYILLESERKRRVR